MDTRKIKEELAIRNISLSSIARKYNCSRQSIHQLFGRSRGYSGKTSLIRKYIATAISKNYEDVWG